MNPTTIDWPGLTHTWNPVVGCLHNCSYCYARSINNRFKIIPDWTKPRFFFERLGELRKARKPRKIFVVSMGDLFGEWVPTQWIIDILQVCNNNPQHAFMFLTKNPRRYYDFEFPLNCWLGATITSRDDFDKYGFYKHKFVDVSNKTFLSLEPLFGGFEEIDFRGVDLIIVGADSRRGQPAPKREWVRSIKHRNIWYKKSIRDLYPEFSNT